MVEIFNQLAGRMIGKKNWAKWGTWDFDRYPTVGHPFADYWGIWVNTDCGEWDLDYTNGTSEFTVKPSTNPNILTGQVSGATGVLKWFTLDSGSWTGGDAAGTLTLKEVSGTFQSGEIITGSKDGSAVANGVETQISKTECCFEMGGCGDPLRPYPPLRQTPITEKMSDLDPSLCFDMSEYGHLGYDPGMGAPNPNSPVQYQYTGTWEIYIPPNDDDRVGQMLADHVLNAAVNPMVYLTNGEMEGVEVGGSVTWEAHVTGGGVPPYTYEWAIQEEADPGWTTVGGDSSTWLWNPGKEDVGTYSVRCSVTDSRPVTPGTGEVTWEGFEVFCDLCNTYQAKYLTCVDLQDANRELDYDVCKVYTDETTCVANYCAWNDKSPPVGAGKCLLDMCLTEVTDDGRVTTQDYGVLKAEFGRSGCP
ncbi:MAG: hypothetical protein JRI87_04905, partial [Deltaproteobacteria bacterium]|nr:hypothetical protein [Deltaproteobacteria bacterium]